MSEGLEAAMSSLEAAEREAKAAEKSVREAEERMMRLSKVSASKTIPAPMTATGYRAAANDKEKGDDAHDDDEPKKKEPNDPFTNGYGTTGYGATAKDEEKGDDDDDDEPKEKKEPNDPFADGFGPYLSHSLDELFNPWKSPMNWLLLCTPFAYYGHHYGGDDVTVFVLSVLAIAPMAERVSFVTEQLAMHTSETVGGLLNATFGNVTELIVSLVALFGGMLRIVQVSLLGSILSNLLLVLGCAFLVGGIKYPEQKYSHKAQTLSFGLLLLAVLCISMPTVLEITHDVEYPEHSSLDVSRSMSLMMIVTYYLYLVFRTRMHANCTSDCSSDCLPHGVETYYHYPHEGDLLPLRGRPSEDHKPRWAPIRGSQASLGPPRCCAVWDLVLECLGPHQWPSRSVLQIGLPTCPPNLSCPARVSQSCAHTNISSRRATTTRTTTRSACSACRARSSGSP